MTFDSSVFSSLASSSPVLPPPVLVLFFSALAASSSLGLFPLQMIAMRWPSGDQVAVPTVSPSLHGCIVRACLLCKFRIASRSEEHTSELQSLMRISYAVFCLKKKKKTTIRKKRNIKYKKIIYMQKNINKTSQITRRQRRR